jgi:hypothetical protein
MPSKRAVKEGRQERRQEDRQETVFEGRLEKTFETAVEKGRLEKTVFRAGRGKGPLSDARPATTRARVRVAGLPQSESRGPFFLPCRARMVFPRKAPKKDSLEPRTRDPGRPRDPVSPYGMRPKNPHAAFGGKPWKTRNVTEAMHSRGESAAGLRGGRPVATSATEVATRRFHETA